MNGQDWLNYWQAQQKPEDRKADWLDSAGALVGGALGALGGPPGMAAGAALGKAAGGTAEDAVNGGVTLQDLMRLGMAAGPVMMPFNLGFAAGGSVPDVTDPMFQQAAMGPAAQPQQPQGPTIRTPQDAADFLRGLEDAMGAMPGGTFTPEAPKHPTLEMLASVVPDVVKALPAPRQTNSVNKTIGAWLPAAATAFSAPINYGKAQREERNKKGSEAAKALADHRWAVAKSMVDSIDTQRGTTASSGSMEQPIPDEMRAALKIPSWVKNQRDLNTWQEERNRQSVVDERAAAKAQKDAEAADKQAAQDSEEARYVDAVTSFRESPIIPMGSRSFEQAMRLRGKIDEALKPTGYSRGELELLWKDAEQFGRAGNSQRFNALRGSAETLARHIDSLEKFYRTYDARYKQAKREAMQNPLKFGSLPDLNQGLFHAAQKGLLGDAASAQAAALAPFITVVGNELPIVLASGYAPQKEQYAEANAILSDKLGPRANEARIKALKKIVGDRLYVYSHMKPFQRGKNGKPNPYTLDVNPIYAWENTKSDMTFGDSMAEQFKRGRGK